MADINIDRQMLVSSGNQGPGPGIRAVGLVALMVLIGALGFLGVKLALTSSVFNPSVRSSSNLDQIQQQLDDINKRLDTLEKHRRTSVTLPAKAPEKAEPASTVSSAKPNRPAGPAFTVSSASLVKPEPSPAPGAAPATQPAVAALNEAAVANHEAWEATTDRLADVVGAVGSQQGELTRTRDQVNQLMAQTRRSATQFELRRGMGAQPVGPVSLVLKDSDVKRQRYTVCVYVSKQCVELKDRAVDEVVVFAPSHDGSPLELIATKVTRNGIVGYLEVPANK